MSLINGIFERKESVVSKTTLSSSLETLKTTSASQIVNKAVSSQIVFGHSGSSLLSENDKLPFTDVEAGLTINCEARIDNRSELFDKLRVTNKERENFSDFQIILRAWQKWGQDCPTHLIGDYAFVIWDERQKLLFCARDHIGIEPFYYNITNERFIFSNNIKTILAVPEISKELDEEYLISSIAHKYARDSKRTYYKSIHRLPPGHTLTISKSSEKLEKYWFPQNIKRLYYSNDEYYIEEARELLTKAVDDRLRTDKKTGVHLSGGLDSSVIAVLASRKRRKQNLSLPETFVWQPPPEDNNNLSEEYERIEKICKQEGLSPIYCPATAQDILEILKKDPTKEPIGSAMRLERTIQKEASQRNVSLILSGWGGDETLSFNGRGYISELLLHGKFIKLLQESRKHKSALGFLVYEFLLPFFSDREEGIKKLKSRSFKNQRKVSPYLRSELRNKVNLRKLSCRQLSTKSSMLWLWNLGHLSERTESWSALGSPLKVKYAYPLLDRRLMEFAIGLPRDSFVKNNWKRWIMRKTIEDFVPHEVAWQQNKNEPARFESSEKTFKQALELAGKEIALDNKVFSRAKYIDIARLQNSITPKNLAAKKKGDILRALQFLDF